MPSKFVFFDLGNVLVTLHPHNAAKHLAESAGCDVQKVLNTVFTSDLQKRYETGLIHEDQYAQEVSQLLGQELTTQSVMEAICSIFQPNWPILSVLERVRAAQLPIGILSNTCDAHWQWLMRQDWPMLHGWFEHRVLSYEVRSMKPDGGIYAFSEEICGLKGQQIFFTDDRPENIKAAADRGWATYQFGQADELAESLERWLR
jgi:FMN phosphatase YigB (HAD superfamily)